MSRAIDIKKHVFDEFEYYSPADSSYTETAIARLRKVTPFGQEVIPRYRSSFGSLTRTLVCKLQKQDELDKSKLCSRFGYREVNYDKKTQQNVITWEQMPMRTTKATVPGASEINFHQKST